MKVQYGILLVFISLLLVPAVAAETQYDDCEIYDVGLISDYEITLKDMDEETVTIKVEGPTEVRTRTIALGDEYNFFDELYVNVLEIDYAEKELNRDATFEICDITRNICSKENILLFFKADLQLDHTADYHGTDVSVEYIGTSKAEIKYNSNKKTLSEGDYYTADNIRVHLEEIKYDDNRVNSRVSLKICQPGEGSTQEVSFEETEQEQEQEEKVYRATTDKKQEETTETTSDDSESRGGFLAKLFNWLFSLF